MFDFKPIIVIIQEGEDTAPSNGGGRGLFLNPMRYGEVYVDIYLDRGISAYAVQLDWAINGVSWYNSSYAGYQLNYRPPSGGGHYDWLAIGVN